VGEHDRGAVRKAAPPRKPSPAGPLRPPERRGEPSTGRIARLSIGQGHGFIRAAGGREIYFHRSDLQEGVSFNAFSVGDTVAFELFEDAVSGARALRVRRRRRDR
jgi:cold shock CspA family protein